MSQCSKFGEQLLRANTRVDVCENVAPEQNTQNVQLKHIYMYLIYMCVSIYVFTV
jgi:hypothetical protein